MTFSASSVPTAGGKTTLIKCILGLLRPTGGEIVKHHEPLTTGYLPQYNSIDRSFPISVLEVILSGLSSKKSLISRFDDPQREKARQVILRMGLEGLEHRAIGQLSGGQLQRALLGRAIISDPQLLILDEPSTYIDKRFEDRGERKFGDRKPRRFEKRDGERGERRDRGERPARPPRSSAPKGKKQIYLGTFLGNSGANKDNNEE